LSSAASERTDVLSPEEIKFGDLGTSEVRELRQRRKENRKLKQLVADLSLDKTILQESLKKR